MASALAVGGFLIWASDNKINITCCIAAAGLIIDPWFPWVSKVAAMVPRLL